MESITVTLNERESQIIAGLLTTLVGIIDSNGEIDFEILAAVLAYGEDYGFENLEQLTRRFMNPWLESLGITPSN